MLMKAALRRVNLTQLLYNYTLILIGTAIAAMAVVVFQIPAQIAPGGVTGVSIILNHLFGTPVGLVMLLLNIPIMLLGYRMLGGWHTIIGTIVSILLASFLIDFLTPRLAPDGISDDSLLNALFAGIVGGFGGGLVYRAGATMGGTSTLVRIINDRFGIPLSSASLYFDGFVVAAAGLVFGWEQALFAIVALFVGGAASDYSLEGPSVIRTATIITDFPEEVSNVIINTLGRGVTSWEGTGMYTGHEHTILFVTVGRSQVSRLRKLVIEADPAAFVVIGQGHTAYGYGFRANPPQTPDQVE
jgi:uncharacterized membrane-anchored protein YitT (DUF2179 family)